jgi:hypothetical protein
VKIRQVGAELFHADGRTDMTNLTVAFRNFANEPKKSAQSQEVFIVRLQPETMQPLRTGLRQGQIVTIDVARIRREFCCFYWFNVPDF